MDDILKIAKIIKNSKFMVVFTGAGISVESGIPTFRGKEGLWNKYNPEILDINFFYENPILSWNAIKKIFYDFSKNSSLNFAHKFLFKLESNDILKKVITQNIDNLHTIAGNKRVLEFHGTLKTGICIKCNHKVNMYDNLKTNDIYCPKCKGIIKPNFVFFGEGIDEFVYKESVKYSEKADVMLVIGTGGEVMPANLMPKIAKQNNAIIIEINPNTSYITQYADFHIKLNATLACEEIYKKLY